LDWNAKNNQADRRKDGARKLAQMFANAHKDGKCKHLVICHSHGGNVALYAAADERMKGVSGIICMNTPFICALPRNFTPIFQAIGYVIALILCQLASWGWLW